MRKLPGLLLGAFDGGSLERRVLQLIDARLPWARRWRVVSAALCISALGAASWTAGIFGVRVSAQTKLPEFGVVSVKLSDPAAKTPIGLFTYPGGRVVCSQCPLQYLIVGAFNVQPFQVTGGPDWMGMRTETRFDVEGKPPASSPSIQSNPASFKNPPNEEQRQMLQALLLDRFHLKFHREDREGPVYLLERNDKDLKLHAPKDPNEFSWAGSPEAVKEKAGAGLTGRNISMPQLAKRLSEILRRPVLDRTGLEGSFDFEYRLGAPDGEESPADTVKNSLPELGLKLMEGRGPVETIVVESVSRPTEN